jgi:hypothetical protein
MEASTTHCGGSVAFPNVNQSLHVGFLAGMLQWLIGTTAEASVVFCRG